MPRGAMKLLRFATFLSVACFVMSDPVFAGDKDPLFATLIACPICMKHYAIKESDLLDGVKVGNPQLTGDASFRDNTKTLGW